MGQCYWLWLFTLVLMTTPLFSRNRSPSSEKKPLIIAHRGASVARPENTLASFSHAIACGADGIELDVHCCKSGELVVIHDEQVGRTTDGRGAVADLTLTELKQLRIASEHKIPTLQEVIELVNRRVFIDVELKGAGTGRSTAELLQQVISTSECQPTDFVVTSFSFHELEQFHEGAPDVPTGWLIRSGSFSRLLKMIKQEERPFFQTVGFCYVWLPLKLVRLLHQRGYSVFVYTVNSQQFGLYACKQKVDGIITDVPDKMREWLT